MTDQASPDEAASRQAMIGGKPGPREWQDFYYTTQDGLRLGGRKYGWDNLDHPPVLCLPGLTRNAADFHELALYLAGHAESPRRVLCLDCRGRGMSQYDSNWQNYNPLTEAEDTISGVLAAGLERVSIIGTSRGGLIAMILLAMRPGMMHACVLNDVGPELDGPGLVRLKQYLEHMTTPASWQEATDYLENSGRKHFPGYSRQDWEKQARNMLQEDGDKLKWRFDPALAKTVTTLDLDQPIPTMWEQFAGFRYFPLMGIRGANSELLSAATFERMQREIPHMASLEVEQQGHAPDLGSANIPAEISAFLRRVDAGDFDLSQ